MTNPNDPWGQRPEEAPTEYLGKSGYEPSLHTTEYNEAYGQSAPSTYPAAEQFDSWSPPPPNATREMPTLESQWSGTQQWGPNGPVPPGGPPPQQEPPRRNTGLWVLLGIGVILLVGAAGVVAGVLLGDKGSSNTSAQSTTTAQLPAPTRSGQPGTSGIPSIPGLGNVDTLGATLGTITANSGGTLTINSLLGSTVTVHTDDKTQVISVSAAKAADLPVGDVVVVQGDKAADGSIQAKVIISTSLPGGPK
ncbi:DUF5666 domain-containing protein [Nocardia arthritidis]|uniref:DUF5666 domain-containing protein n=1 Tax=Nocardia arthritidis TaxID=228602 RepID=A0A6G9YTM7_9NOCA|nr:DUF5666 domain-containing protein [Nocardia arthritidis]QIS16366.1 hypothetical protein F5544_42790 [Nocardia arthritidis]